MYFPARLSRAALAIPLAALACGGLAACGSSSDSSDTATGGAAAASATGASTSAADSTKQVKLAMELTLTGVKFGQDMKAGIEAYAKADGHVDLTVSGPPSIDPVTAQKQATDMLAQRPDGFGVSPFPPELWQRTLKTIKSQVPNSLTFNIKPSGKVEDVASSPMKTFVGVDDAQGAHDTLVKLIEMAKLPASTTGEVLLGQCVAANTGVLYERIQGFKKALAEKLPQATPIVFDSKVDPQGNTATWTSELQAHPKPVLAIGTCDQDGTSLYKVKRSQHLTFPVGALEAPPEVIAGIEDGTILVSTAVNWYLQGYVAAKFLVDGARGTAFPEGFIDVGTVLITKENVGEIKERESSDAARVAWNAPKIKEFLADVQAHVHPMQDAWK